MSIITAGKARIAALGAVALATGSIGTLLISEPAEAIPTPQRSCTTTSTGSRVETTWTAVNSAVTIDNGKVARKVVVHFTADTVMSDYNTMMIGYRVDKGPIQTVGQSYFVRNMTPGGQGFGPQPGHGMTVLDVPKGKHRIQPYLRVWEPGSDIVDSNMILGRCLTAEAYTN